MRPRRHLRPPLVLLAAAIAGAALGGCAEDGTSPSADLGGLLVLAGAPGDAALRAWADGAAPDDDRAVETPKGTSWVAGGRADVLVADLVNGTLRTSDPVDPDEDPTWRKVSAAGADGKQADGPFYFPSWDPEGGRFAALAGDLDAEPRLTLIDPSARSAFEVDLGRPVVAAPPVWVGDDLVAVAVGDATSPASILVDTTTGEITDGPSGGRLLATSADARTIAVVGGDGDTIAIRSTEAWLTEDGSSVGSIDAPPGVVAPTALALDADGTRLAVAWLDDGGRISVAVHDRSAAWRRVANLDVGDAAGAVVTWQR
jgi:hypothetical protein